MTFYEKYENRLIVAWCCICVTMPVLALAILIWDDEVKEMLNEIKVEEKKDDQK